MSSPLTTELERLQQLAEGQLGDEELEQLSEILDDHRRFDDLVTQLVREPGSLLESLRKIPKVRNRKARRFIDRILQGVSEIASAVNSFDNTQSIPAEIQKPMARAERTHPARRPPAGVPNEMIHFESFRIRGILGRGGMGTVFQADDERLGRQVAIKTLNRELAIQPGAIDRFLREARTAARVEHDHICPIYQVGEENGIPFIAMPLLKGEPLNERIKREQRIPVSETLRIGREIALGLAAAHEAGLIHRDIKPANIWLETQRGRPSRVRILDFGLARGHSDETELSTPGLVMGTPAYMSPEQARGFKLDARADLWSLGVILYEMVVGNRPFMGTDSMALLTNIAVDEPAPPEKFNLAVTPQFSRLIMRLLSKKLELRPVSALEVVETIQQIQIESTFPMIEEMPARPLIPEAEAVTESDFAHLEDDPTFIEKAPEPPKTESIKKQLHSNISSKPLRKKTAKSWIWQTTGISGLLIVVIVGVVLIMNKVRPPRQIEAAEPVKEEVKKESKPAAPKPVTPPKAAETDQKDPDRRAAEIVLAAHGMVGIPGSDTLIPSVEALPKGPFQLSKVMLFETATFTDASMSVFKECKNLKSLFLFNDRLTDASLAHFKECKSLTRLVLGGQNFSDAGVANFKDCKMLEELRLTLPRLTDSGLAVFGECKEIRSLAITDAPKVTRRGLAAFENHRAMRLLCLIHLENVTDENLTVFKNFNDLDLLQLDNCKNITDAGLTVFQNCKKLNSLNLARLSVSDKGLAPFAESATLRNISLMETPNVTDASAELIGKLPSLNVFDSTRNPISRAALEKIYQDRPNVRIRWNGETIGASPDRATAEITIARGGTVRINNTSEEIGALTWLPPGPFQVTGIRFEPSNNQANDDLMAKAAQCKSLRHLAMWKSAVTDAGLAHFRGAKELFEIHFEDTPITDAGLANFSECKKLIVIGLNRTKITDEGLKAFKGNTNFAVIALEDTNVGSAGLSQFGECKFLECLALAGTRTTDADLDLFKESKVLRRLYLGRTQVTDAAVPKILQFKNLAELGLQGTKLSLEKIEELKKGLPNCKIILEGK